MEDGRGKKGHSLTLPYSHFNNVGQLAWGTVLQAGEVIDDQAGNFCGATKAYGPYQSRMLRDGDYGKALINNENYVWFFLVSDEISMKPM